MRGNTIAAAAGFFLASQGNVSWGLLAAVLFGTACIIAASCVINNYIDRSIDAAMLRTQKRGLVSGRISAKEAFVFAAVLFVIGFTLLALYTNALTVYIGILGVVFYVAVYGVAKRRSHHGTLIGSISGSTPPVAGYTAVTNELDTAAVILFLVLTFWQMPHFYAIAIFRKSDYAKAKIPVLPLAKGMLRTKLEIYLYIIAFIFATLSLTLEGYTGLSYAFIMLGLGLWWLLVALQGFRAADDTAWARKVFGISLLSLLVLSGLLMIDVFLP